jgi:phosphate:Na+ symporter
MNASPVLIEIVGAVAMLLWAVRLVRTGITRTFGGGLRSLVARAGSNRLAAWTAGFVATTVLQSSTATALIVASLASREILPTLTALAVMLGADVGTTVAAQILSFRPHFLAPVLLTLGVVLFQSAESGPRRHIGRFCFGLGLLLLSLRLLLEATAPLRDSPSLALAVDLLGSDPTVAVLVAAILTWLAHSSLAIVVLVMSFASHGVVDVDVAVAMVVGANIGGAVAPVVMTGGSGPVGRRAPVGNLALRTLGAALCLPFLDVLQPWIAALGPDPARQVVNFHTAFNLALAVLAMPVLPLLARLLERLLPAPAAGEDPGAPHHLDRDAVDTPAVALAAAAREALRMGDIVQWMLERALEALRVNDFMLIHEIKSKDDILDRLHEAIKHYLIHVARQELDAAESRRYQEILAFVTNMEHIGDIIDLNLMEIAEKKARDRLRFSPQGFEELRRIHEAVMDNLQLALGVFMTRDVRLARRLVASKATIRELERRAAENHLRRLTLGVPDTLQTTSLHLDVIRDLKRINSHLTAIAYPLLEETGELRATRLAADTAPDGVRAPATGGTEEAKEKAAPAESRPDLAAEPRSP